MPEGLLSRIPTIGFRAISSSSNGTFCFFKYKTLSVPDTSCRRLLIFTDRDRTPPYIVVKTHKSGNFWKTRYPFRTAVTVSSFPFYYEMKPCNTSRLNNMRVTYHRLHTQTHPPTHIPTRKLTCHLSAASRPTHQPPTQPHASPI